MTNRTHLSQIRIFLSAFLVCTLSIANSQTRYEPDKIFPTPEVLKPNVEFWKNVYAKYSERDVIIHDARDLQIVYEVVHLDSLFRGVKVSSRIESKKIEQIKKTYISALLRLAKKGKTDIDKLYGKERYVAKLFGPNVTAKELRAAAKRLRGQSGLRERFRKGLIRSGLYLAEMKRIFREQGLPLELLALPHVESSYNYMAYSKLGAAGLWQFTRSTGRQYMKVGYNIDERLDPITATRSAAKLLQKNYRTLATWPLAITAYNHGRNGMRRAKKKFGTDIGNIVRHYRSRSFGFASRNFYSEFLAALHVSSHYRQYFGELTLLRPQKHVEFKLPHYITVKTLSAKTGISVEELALFNPALRRPVLTSKRRIPKNFVIRIPVQSAPDMEALYAEISPKFKFNEQVQAAWHKVRSGESLGKIARRYRVRLKDLMAANNIRNAHRIYVGQNLQIPGKTSQAVTTKRPATPKPSETRLADATDVAAKKSLSRSVQLETPASKQPQADISPNSDVTYIQPKSRFSTTGSAPTTPPMQLKKEGAMLAQYASVEDIMEMALPDFHVELTANMEMRVVRNAKVEALHETFRDLEMPENGQIIVEPDETLGHFAEWLKVPTHKLRRINQMAYGTPIKMGQPLWLTFENVTPEEFHRSRVEYHQGIEEDFYRNFRIQGESAYKVRRGDNVWIICNRRFEMPSWLLKKYNPDKNLTNLRAGQELSVPIVEAKYPQDVISN